MRPAPSDYSSSEGSQVALLAAEPHNTELALGLLDRNATGGADPLSAASASTVAGLLSAHLEKTLSETRVETLDGAPGLRRLIDLSNVATAAAARLDALAAAGVGRVISKDVAAAGTRLRSQSVELGEAAGRSLPCGAPGWEGPCGAALAGMDHSAVFLASTGGLGAFLAGKCLCPAAAMLNNRGVTTTTPR